MERTLTAIATGLWIAPLLALGAMYLYAGASPNTGGSDHDIAKSMMTVLIGIVAGAAGFVVALFLVRASVRPGQFLYVQVVDGIALAGLMVWAFIAWSGSAQRVAPAYDGYQAILDVEVRAPKALLAGKPFDTEMAIHFGAGNAMETAHPELIREDGDHLILPVEMNVMRLNGWSVTSQHGGKRYWFDLNLPDHPKGPIPWSDWIKPVAKKDWDVTDSVTVRCRWALQPYGGPPRVY